MSGSMVLVDAAGRRRSPATLPGFLAGRAPHNKGMQYPPDPPRPEEIIQVMRRAGDDRHGLRIRALIGVLWRGGLWISEALALNETDIDARRGSLLIRHGKGDKRREAGMDPFGFEQLAAWTAPRTLLPPGPLFCVIDGATRGRGWSASAARAELRQLAVEAGVRRRFAPHQLRHAHAVELAREGVAVNIIQRQLGHTDLGTTSTYLQGIDPSEIIDAVRSRRQPTIPATAGWVGFWTKEWREEQFYEIGWSVMPEFQGRGIAVAGTGRAIELAKRDDKHCLMHAFPSLENAPSNAICRKLGFELIEACEFEFPKGHFMTCNDWCLDLRV